MPFSTEQFLDVFARYNTAIWPAQLGALAIGVAIVVCLQRARASRFVALALVLLWVFTGVAYFGAFFAAINPAAYVFGALFVLQGALLMHAGLRADQRPLRRSRPILGMALAAYALLAYPLLAFALGHVYPRMPAFGVAPCPLAIFTLGVLLSANRLPRALFAIPIVWSAIGGSASWLLGVREDIGLLVAGAAAIGALWSDRPRLGSARAQAHAQR